MAQVHPRFDRSGESHASERRFDSFIEQYVPTGARVIDLGCGSGELLEHLIATRQVNARGVEISAGAVKNCIEKGLSVYHGDIDDGLVDFDDQVFDIVVLNETLPMLHHPDKVLNDIVRIGKKAVITFQNAAYLPRVARFIETGSVNDLCLTSDTWHNSPNIHPFSISDFCSLCDSLGIQVNGQTIVDESYRPLSGLSAKWPNLWGFAAVFCVHRN